MDKKFLTPKKHHPLIKVWNSYPEFLQNTTTMALPAPSIERIIGEIFAPGKFYYYVINLVDSTLSHHHENILEIHGFHKYPVHLKEIIDLLHPDDIEFVMEAERMCIEKMKDINGFDYIQELKSSYCFRLRTSKGNYELFHHQALHTLKDENGKLMQAVNIHTNIEHITHQNSYSVLLSGINGREDFHQMQWSKYNKISESQPAIFTKREVEIITYIARGFSAGEISNVLNISEETVRTHRKNILRKSDCKNCSELIKMAFEWGYL
ncbi:helix-turn-helix transcriptional regulator [Chryseobacterium lactis]|uniref:DNA-binding response regulator n=1 Tax=Chryseobacterium lactis TaxID=1241981 RepID=A0A3G6RN33_CHRLC|nr:LuxR C-terminal-related transcriptional regulator [Chryseobacterium lactis]AZA80676.1 DNA-binding response regulator [Chryseobacterium lactis]AZB05678.1 DNA-binding response regulator [Chryseobacterium lactis]PNW13603.1 helix-turn-helix transcriptional regulator [Chryseobacterium lactis]